MLIFYSSISSVFSAASSVVVACVSFFSSVVAVLACSVVVVCVVASVSPVVGILEVKVPSNVIFPSTVTPLIFLKRTIKEWLPSPKPCKLTLGLKSEIID